MAHLPRSPFSRFACLRASRPTAAVSTLAVAVCALALLAAPSSSLAQTVLVGEPIPLYGGDVSPTAVQTIVQTEAPANIAGNVTSATFGWSATPCPAAAKIKFFRPVAAGNPTPAYNFLTERGPFDVNAPASTTTITPPALQTVVLDPPVALHAGDVIAITNLTTCGGPTYVGAPPGVLQPAPSSFTVPGDVTTDIVQPSTLNRAVFVAAVGATSSLELLGRFQVTLLAVDPRTGRQTAGFPVPLGSNAGFFSLPELTGYTTFPEVIVKMADATGTPSLGGTFWFFHASMTDLHYTLTVTDITNRRVRTYESQSGSPGQLCGGVDTSAFTP